MKFIINTTNLQSGGALQVALSLLEEWKLFEAKDEFHILLSPQLEGLLVTEKFPQHFHFYRFKTNPTQSLLSTFTFYKQLQKKEAQIKPDAVFTIFGPALWTPKSPHLVGFANGYYLFEDARFIQENICANIVKKIQFKVRKSILFYQLKKESSYCWVETMAAKQRLAMAIQKDAKEISVIGNTYSQHIQKSTRAKQPNSSFKLLYLSAYYEHKNFEIIAQVITILKQKKRNCTFILTLPKGRFEAIFRKSKDTQYLQNLGPVHPHECKPIYEQADAVFMPSMLETFSANYPEAMKMELPMICSDFDFSRAICGEAALYFDAHDPENIANKIIELMDNKVLQEQLIQSGKKRLEEIETPESRAQKLMQLLTQIAQT
jgi:glycosyltransferase involved in cell wall biosynthesis